ncbi:MAG: ISAs1 family transposase [Actinomycetota bacterium]|nr:ISAs1 family transposase [Actinomycetota bacterium]
MVTDAVQALDVPGEPLSATDSIKLLSALGSVPDPRKRRGIRHSVQSILLLVVGAVLVGKTTWVGIAGWAARADHRLRVCGPTPSAATFARVLAAIDPAALQTALNGWMTARLAARSAPQTESAPVEQLPPRQVLAVDGKVLRGARTPGGQVKLIAAYDHAAGVVCGQVAVVGGDEIAALPAVCDTIADLHAVLITADALHCQRSHADYLVGRGAHYALTVKANQRTLRDALAHQPWGQVPGLVQRSVGHGRRETRSIKVLSMDSQPQLAALFPHAAQIAKIVRRRRRRGRNPTMQTVYLITDLDHRQATPEQLAGYARGQWTIENGLHWVRDVTFGEDRSQVRTGAAPQNLAAIRNTVIGLFRLLGHHNIAAAHQLYADQPHLIAPLLDAA